MQRFGLTFARRVCSYCNASKGFGVWPWSGRVFVTTHVLCAGCAREQMLLAG